MMALLSVMAALVSNTATVPPFIALMSVIYLSLAWARFNHWISYIVAGAALGALILPHLPFPEAREFFGTDPFNVDALGVGAFMGIASALGTWLSLRPDRIKPVGPDCLLK
jgi:hypothetical protein